LTRCQASAFGRHKGHCDVVDHRGLRLRKTPRAPRLRP
jgi:hypothetical protein